MEIKYVKCRYQCVSCEDTIGRNSMAFCTSSGYFICMNCVEEIHDMFEHAHLEKDKQLKLDLE